MAVTVAQLAGELGFNDGTGNPPEPVLTKLTTRLNSATKIVERYISQRAIDGVTVPDEVKDLAIVLTASYRFDQHDASRGTGYANAFLNSGAKAELKPWCRQG